MAKIIQTLRQCPRLAAKAARFIVREPSSASLMFRMGGWVILLTLLVKSLPLPLVMRMITPRLRRATRHNAALTETKLARLLDLLLATDFWIFTPTCWKRAPVLYRYLALHGIESRVVFGVRKNGGGLLDGHSWLEADGKPLLEPATPDYTVTFSFPINL